jgi:hypothetical protein
MRVQVLAIFTAVCIVLTAFRSALFFDRTLVRRFALLCLFPSFSPPDLTVLMIS